MYANGHRISPQMLRQVWAAVTAHPQMPIRALAKTLRRSNSTVIDTLHALRDAGYINFEDRTERTRTVLVPFIELRNRNGHR